ncbi:uncharacterized protein LOC110373625 [Helicoverpa armigera]|uniref:uncharacterized protein LOC110373625 n=1 Tax=Helicoverpa armigera TaxID=29058 RepID=UPI00308288D9
MYSKRQLKEFLSEISQNAEFPIFTYVSAEKFVILIRCRVEPDRDARYYTKYNTEWIKKFTKFTKTGWIVRHCFPKLKRLVYRKTFVCQYSGFNKTKNPKQTAVRNKHCEAKIDFKVKFINRNTIRNDEMLKKGLNLSIFINYMHSHKVLTKESLKLLRCSVETDELFYKYYAEGHSEPTAKSYHELTLLVNSTDGSNPLRNTEVNPSARHINYLFCKKKKEGTNPSTISDIMPEKIKLLEESGGMLKHSEDYNTVVVITPFMKSVLTCHDLDSIIVDSTVLKEHVVSFFLVPTPLGALPIACALHTESKDKIHMYNPAFNYTKTVIESQISKTFEPTEFMVNENDENYALEEVFPNTSLSETRVSLLEGIWQTICKADVKIEAKESHDLMESFNTLLYDNNFEKADMVYKKLEEDMYINSILKLKEYVVNIWERRDELNTPNKLIDVSLRMLKQFLLSRCNSYSIVIMIDVLLNILDKHWHQILYAHLSNKSIVETYTKLLPVDREVIKTAGMKDNVETVENKKRKKNHTFNIETMCCDCVKGSKGEFCEHLCAALHSVNLSTTLSEEQRVLYTSLIGKRDIKPELLTEQEDDLEKDIEPTSSDNEQNDFEIKEEIVENDDPLDDGNNENVDNSEYRNNNIEVDNDMKNSYVAALTALNDEFRRLNRLFMDNPSASNLDNIRQLARELSKIRPVEKVELSNIFVDINKN